MNPSDVPGSLRRLTMTSPFVFVTLGLHHVHRDEACQAPRITAAEALTELARDLRRAELRTLMEEV